MKSIFKFINKFINPVFGEKIFGFPIELHYTVTIFVTVVAMSSINIALFLTAVYFSVLLHEFGHVLVAKYYNYKTNRISLYIFGGAAEIEFDEFDVKAKDEFLIAIAGPVINLIIFTLIIIFYVTYYSYDEAKTLLANPSGVDKFFFDLGTAQLYIAAFNLLPIYPMDGGRILRSIFIAMSKNISLSNKIVSYFAINAAILIILYYTFFSSFNLNMYLIMGLIILYNYSNLKKLFKREKMLKNLPQHVIVIGEKSFYTEHKECLHGIFTPDPTAPNSYMQLIELWPELTFNFHVSYFKEIDEPILKLKKLNYVEAPAIDFEDITPTSASFHHFKLKDHESR